MELIKYDAACRAIAEAHAIDEVKQIHDIATAFETYTRQANNKEMEIQAGEIRFRAERRLGELMRELRDTGELHEGGRPPKTGLRNDPVLTLKARGINKQLANRARKYAAMPDPVFERTVAERRALMSHENGRVTIHLIDSAREKAERRAAREAELGRRQCALPRRRFGVIIADPEWGFEPWSRETGMDRAAGNHYPTSATEVIAARDVPSIAADDAVLGLWATVPMLLHAALVMGEWGFDYKTHWVWAKDRIGTGYWNRNKHEIFLFGTRGSVPCPAQGEQWDSLLEAPRRGHSEKPEIFLEMMESYFPHLPKIELNRRGAPRPGWDAWGNEAMTDADQCQERPRVSAVS